MESGSLMIDLILLILLILIFSSSRSTKSGGYQPSKSNKKRPPVPKTGSFVKVVDRNGKTKKMQVDRSCIIKE